jgi:hypothetical protein
MSKHEKLRPVWQLLEPRSVTSVGGATFKRLDDGSWLATGANPANDEYRIEIPLESNRLSGILLETSTGSFIARAEFGARLQRELRTDGRLCGIASRRCRSCRSGVEESAGRLRTAELHSGKDSPGCASQ